MAGILYGSTAGIVTNIAAAISCGVGAGIISSIFYHKVHPSINKMRINDSYGLILILVISLLATLLVPTMILLVYYHY